MWKHQKFVEKVSDQKTPKDVAQTSVEFFPTLAKATKKTTPASQFHKVVRHIFKAKDTSVRTDSKQTLGVLSNLQKLYPIYEMMYIEPKTLRQKLSEVRKVLEAHQSEEAYTKSKYDQYFNMSSEARGKITKAYKTQVKEKNANKIQIDQAKIYEQIRELIQSDNVYDKILSLMVCLGTRPVELFDKNEFHLVKGKPSWVRVSGLAKKRDTQDKTDTERPVIYFPAEFVIQEIDKIRKHFKDLVVINKQGRLASDKNATLNQHALKAFPFLENTHQKSSFLRKIYADLSFKQFADQRTTNFNTWISEVLGHDMLDLSTSFSYSYVNVADEKAIKDSDVMMAKINELQEQILLLMTDKLVPSATPTRGDSSRVTPTATSPVRENKKEQKFAKMKAIYDANPGITNADMRKKSKYGSKIVNEFMKSQT